MGEDELYELDKLSKDLVELSETSYVIELQSSIRKGRWWSPRD